MNVTPPIPRRPDQIRDEGIRVFNEIAKPKYDAGQEEHGGNLDESVRWKDLQDEVIDLWYYLESKRHQSAARVEVLEKRIEELTAENARLYEMVRR